MNFSRAHMVFAWIRLPTHLSYHTRLQPSSGESRKEAGWTSVCEMSFTGRVALRKAVPGPWGSDSWTKIKQQCALHWEKPWCLLTFVDSKVLNFCSRTVFFQPPERWLPLSHFLTGLCKATSVLTCFLVTQSIFSQSNTGLAYEILSNNSLAFNLVSELYIPAWKWITLWITCSAGKLTLHNCVKNIWRMFYFY